MHPATVETILASSKSAVNAEEEALKECPDMRKLLGEVQDMGKQTLELAGAHIRCAGWEGGGEAVERIICWFAV